MYTGKGGVGKTSIACATAVFLAENGKRVLLVSTDPASNLDEVLQTRLGMRPTLVEKVKGLYAMNVDPEEAARQYRERVVGPYRELLPESAVKNIEEQLSGACTLEIAAFDEFAKLLGDAHATSDFDHVIFDTAPTGHTLRLLQLPAAWSGFIDSNVGGTSCLGPLAGLQAQRELYEKTMASLSDATTTTIFLVSRPEHSALAEAERTRNELDAIGLKNQKLILNGIFQACATNDSIAIALERRGCEALADMPNGLEGLPRIEVPLVAQSLIGVGALRRLGEGRLDEAKAALQTQAEMNLPPSLAALIPDLIARGKGVIMTMGKGGVGKTTVAAALAMELARSGHRVHLTTTDPAAHVHLALREDIPGLRVSRIDPIAETRAYTAEVMSESGRDLDAKGRALLEEDLRSPCTEEIAVFRAFARCVDEGNLPQLRDPNFTRIIIVTLPEATPVHEAARLQDDLNRAAITPYAWVINQSFYATGTRDPLLAKRGALELRYIAEVRDKLARRLALVPWQAESPVGAEGLQQLLEETVTK